MRSWRVLGQGTPAVGRRSRSATATWSITPCQLVGHDDITTDLNGHTLDDDGIVTLADHGNLTISRSAAG